VILFTIIYISMAVRVLWPKIDIPRCPTCVAIERGRECQCNKEMQYAMG